MITIKYHGVLAKMTQKQEEQFNCNKLKDLLKEIKKHYGSEAYKYAKMSYIMINDENAGSIKGYNTSLKEGDVVKLLPICGGG